jgi:hypothetical protein
LLNFFFKSKSPWANPFNFIDICTNSVCTNLYLHSTAFVKLLCHFLFVFEWCHYNGRRKRMSCKFYCNFTHR